MFCASVFDPCWSPNVFNSLSSICCRNEEEQKIQPLKRVNIAEENRRDTCKTESQRRDYILELGWMEGQHVCFLVEPNRRNGGSKHQFSCGELGDACHFGATNLQLERDPFLCDGSVAGPWEKRLIFHMQEDQFHIRHDFAKWKLRFGPQVVEYVEEEAWIDQSLGDLNKSTSDSWLQSHPALCFVFSAGAAFEKKSPEPLTAEVCGFFGTPPDTCSSPGSIFGLPSCGTDSLWPRSLCGWDPWTNVAVSMCFDLRCQKMVAKRPRVFIGQSFQIKFLANRAAAQESCYQFAAYDRVPRFRFCICCHRNIPKKQKTSKNIKKHQFS